MKREPRQRSIKDERDQQIETGARSYALEWVIAGIVLLVWFGITG